MLLGSAAISRLNTAPMICGGFNAGALGLRRSIVNGAHRFRALLPKKVGATSSAANQAGGTEEGAPERSEGAGRSSLAVEPQRSKPKPFYRQSTTTHMKARRIYKASQLLSDGNNTITHSTGYASTATEKR